MNQFINPYQRQNQYYPQNNSITWVQGIEGAKAWQLSPNSNIILMDSENDGRFYIKISDNVGMCTLRTFTYTEITNQPTSSVDLSEYVKKSELEQLIKSMLGEQHEYTISANDGKSRPTKQSTKTNV